MKCAVHNCPNTHHEGQGHYLREDDYQVWFCAPCWNFITTGQSSNSQLERNQAELSPNIHHDCLLTSEKKAP